MKIEPYKRYGGKWTLAHDGHRVACSKETYPDEAAARADLSRVLAAIETEMDKALNEIISCLKDDPLCHPKSKRAW